ncbi:DGQHR domain-containing protein [Spirosoma endophyticum]|uniref:DNA sulfur modification protein DndB n=1 Tax=Spirosoma endophyticum TaxID=662367 RepID=A0A1I1X7T0_9BACT|nr:DGQHR domain-containing protein [Spirosoma endophyticum]SFE03412.1 DNA sulfur modification protein DndB [Spirosoma endophyticum]
MATTIKTHAIRCIQNEKEFFITVLDSKVLAEVCYVARREENNKKGFQRVLNEARAKDIAKYMNEEEGVLPSPLIVSAQDNSRFTYEDNYISFVSNANSFLVLDGQHRLYGLFKSENNYHMPVVIFNNLKTNEEVNLFIDINTTQRGVPTTLLLDIKSLSGKETKKEEKQRELFDKLNKESVMAGFMSPSRTKVGYITRVTFNKATNMLFESGYFQDQTVEVIFNAVKNYLQAVEMVFTTSKSSRAKLTNSTLFRAVFEIFNDVTERTLIEFKDLKVDSFYSTLEPISKLNFDNYTGSSNSLLITVVSDMKKELNPSLKQAFTLNNNIF